MEKVILIFSFMDIGVNIISGKKRMREEEREVYLLKKANKLHHVQIQDSFHQKEQRHKWQILLVVLW